MGLAAIAGIGSGAVHAISGPDHVLSLAPLSVGRGSGAWRVGLRWGLGHAAGTLVAAIGLILAVSAVDLPGVEAWGERIAGAALVGLGLWGLLRHRRAARSGVPACSDRGIAALGLVHGLTGAAALLLLLPAATAGSTAFQVIYLAGFSLGSTIAMAALTSALAALSRKGRSGVLLRGKLPAFASACSVALGSVWIAV